MKKDFNDLITQLLNRKYLDYYISNSSAIDLYATGIMFLMDNKLKIETSKDSLCKYIIYLDINNNIERINLYDLYLLSVLNKNKIGKLELKYDNIIIRFFEDISSSYVYICNNVEE